MRTKFTTYDIIAAQSTEEGVQRKFKMIIIEILAVALVLHKSVGKNIPMNVSVKWVEERDEDGRPLNMDIYFDRVVMLCNKNTKTVISTGVLIDNFRVLTSYTPYRNYETSAVVIGILTGRQYNSTSFTYLHKTLFYPVECQRRVKDLDSELTSEQWHGFKKTHSSVHDLYILQMKENLTFLNPNPYYYSFRYISSYSFTPAGPMITVLAKRKDTLETGVKFASLGYTDKEHITTNGTVLSSYEYPYGTSAQVDCEEWMIRDWGRFICIKNNERFLGISSGAPLIHKEKLYGIGSFTLHKGSVSVFVFTDIRTYRKEIFNTCGEPPANDTHAYALQIDPNEEKEADVTTTTPRPLLHLGRRLYDDWL